MIYWSENCVFPSETGAFCVPGVVAIHDALAASCPSVKSLHLCLPSIPVIDQCQRFGINAIYNAMRPCMISEYLTYFSAYTCLVQCRFNKQRPRKTVPFLLSLGAILHPTVTLCLKNVVPFLLRTHSWSFRPLR